MSAKEIAARLASIGESLEAIDAVLVTHEHSDHTCGLIPVLRKSKAAVYLTHLTAPQIDWGRFEPQVRCFQAGQRFSIGDFEVESFTVPHDAVDPVAFNLRACGLKLGLVTDLGYLPESVRFHLRGADLLVLESNHDLDMLKVGPYPWAVKQRVMGRNGHLSNAMVSEFILDGLDRSVRTLVLAHLSEQNNHPAIAEMSAAEALRRSAARASLVVSHPRVQTGVWQF